VFQGCWFAGLILLVASIARVQVEGEGGVCGADVASVHLKVGDQLKGHGGSENIVPASGVVGSFGDASGLIRWLVPLLSNSTEIHPAFI